MDNLFLASLSNSDLAALEPLLKPIKLDQKKILFESGQSITKVYFPTSGIVSLVAVLSNGDCVEAAMVGRDGLVGGSSTMNGKISVYRAIVQMEGEGYACEGQAFKALAMKSQTLHSKVIRHEQTLYVQAQQSAACLAKHHVDARMARWLLRARDLVGSDYLPFTQEFLAEMLGVRRTSISEVAAILQKDGAIEYHRGKIKILSPAKLRAVCCECYLTVKKHYQELLGGPNR